MRGEWTANSLADMLRTYGDLPVAVGTHGPSGTLVSLDVEVVLSVDATDRRQVQITVHEQEIEE